MDFAEAMNKTLNNENVLTENGAVVYKTSGTKLVDFNFKMSSYRDCDENEIVDDFSKVYNENPLLAVKMLFFTGDIREGMGERRVFNACLNWLADNHIDIVEKVMPIIPSYNRWDAVVNLAFNKNSKNKAVTMLYEQLRKDIDNRDNGAPISLLAKWMPSINTSSKSAVSKAYALAKAFGWDARTYRKTLASLRKYLDVVEVKISANKWNEVDYNKVPSKANLKYKNAFMLHDNERRVDFLKKLATGEAKINSAVAFPHDIVHKYMVDCHCVSAVKNKIDITLEEMWKALPNYVNGNENTICVVDGSASMYTNIGNSNITCQDVARSLSIYFAEHMNGDFHNKFITFSQNPQLICFNENDTLKDKLENLVIHDECSNTNIKKVFQLILNTAVEHNMKQEDMPSNILVLSDMEFDFYSVFVDVNDSNFNSGITTLFDNLKKEYEDKGYKMPRLIFWNINSRTNGIPLKENENGVALVSGFSPTIASMVFSNKLDPYEVLIEKLNSERYKAIEEYLQ